MTIDNPASLSSSETGVNSGIKSRKSTYPIQLNVRKTFVVQISQRRGNLGLKSQQLSLGIGNLQPRLKSAYRYLQRHLLVELRIPDRWRGLRITRRRGEP
jgi:hypothetical protein